MLFANYQYIINANGYFPIIRVAEKVISAKMNIFLAAHEKYI